MNLSRLVVLPLFLSLLLATAAAATAVPRRQAVAVAVQPLTGPCAPGAAYDPACDVDHDADVDIFDIQLAAGHWNQSGPYSSGGWDLAGNAGTNPSSNFLGTTDNAALELRVNGYRALRLEPRTDRPNVIGGSFGNYVTSGVGGATIAGGGSELTFNRVTDSYGAIGGGFGNTAGDNAGTVNDKTYGTVGGGSYNTAGGGYSTIAGGSGNTASGDYATIGGGQGNDASSSGMYPTVSGGHSNLANGSYATVGGGNSNQATGTASTVGGGADNWASLYAVVAGGHDNTANSNGTVPGGAFNFAAGNYSLAAGLRAKAYYDGDFVWAGSTDADFGASAADQFIVRASGGVGLGTNAPANQLHVTEAVNLAAAPENHVAQIENTSTGNSGDVLALKIGYTGAPLSSNNYVTFFKGDNSTAGAIEGNGSGGVVLAGPGSQIALWLPRLDPAETMQPGDVVGLHGGRVSRHTDGADQILVVSASAIIAGADPGADRRAASVQVTLLGLVDVRVAGPQQAGDLIVPSGAGDGMARAVPPTAATALQVQQAIGQLWESVADDGEHLVQVIVGQPRSDALLLALLAQVSALQQQNADLTSRLAALEKVMRP